MEFLEDAIEEDSMEAYPKDSKVQFRTKDADINEIERRVVAGEEVDLLKAFGFSEKDRKRIAAAFGVRDSLEGT